VRNSLKVGRFGLSVVLLGRFPPALVFSSGFTALTCVTTSYHFVPHLSCKSFIVKQKLDVVDPLGHRFGKVRRLVVAASGQPQGVGFTALVLSLFVR